MELSKKQMMEEKDAVVIDLFKDKNVDVKSKIASLSPDEKDKLLEKLDNHIEFYSKIASEEHKKYNLRIELAKLRINQIYPQLLKVIKS